MKKLAASSDFIIRSPATSEELESYFRLNAEAFRPDEDTVLVAARRRRFIENDPDFQMIQLRSAFYKNTYVGSCRIQERSLCVDSTSLQIGCVGGVVTHPDYRRQGIATALMQDAFAYAQSRQYSFLLLHGIPDYYLQHGFVDVMEDLPRHAIERALIPEQPVEKCVVREAEFSDVPALLALYIQHNQASMCTFAPTRTLKRQLHYLKNWPEDHHTWIVFDGEGKCQGYILLDRRKGKNQVYEFAANSWPAIVALLDNQNTLYPEELASPAEIYWPLPMSDATYYLLADHLRIRSEIETYPGRGWMARLVSFSAIVKSLLPLWQARWQKHHNKWTGVFAFVVGGERCALDLSPTAMRLVDRPSGQEREVRFSRQVFTQLVFGFRPVSWAVMQEDQLVPDELVPVLDVLFPHKPSWIAGSDYF